MNVLSISPALYYYGLQERREERGGRLKYLVPCCTFHMVRNASGPWAWGEGDNYPSEENQERKRTIDKKE